MPQFSLVRRVQLGVAVALLALMTACVSSPEVNPSNPVESQGSSAASPGASQPASTSAPAPTASASQPPVSEAPPRSAPPAPTAPAASTAGSLTAAQFPQQLPGGFVPTVRPPAEGEYIPNGTWVHAIDADQAAYEAIPGCPANAGQGWPIPRAALNGTYQDQSTRPGSVLALEFATPADATGYATIYRRVLTSCGPQGMPGTEELESDTQWYLGRRSYGSERWSEIVAVTQNRVWLAIINDNGHSATADLRRAAQSLIGA